MKLQTLIISALLALTCTGVLLYAPTIARAFTPGTYDMTIQAGEDYALTAVESNAGTPINLTGNTYAAQCSPSPGAAAFAVYSAYSLNPTAGQITVKLSKAQSLKLAGKTGVWWLRRTDAAGLTSYRLAGKCAVVPR